MQNKTFGQAFKEGLGTGLGMLVVYTGAFIALSIWVARQEPDENGNDRNSRMVGAAACSFPA
jgi:hypothetical protein